MGKGELMEKIINLIGCVQEAPVHHLEEELDRLTNKIVSTKHLYVHAMVPPGEETLLSIYESRIL